jgi:1,2-phenylacetyl-CoA epoxidase PaaB subunit
MPKRKREHMWYTWEVRRLKSSPALLLGLVDAEDEAEALERAIEQFDVRPEDQKRLLVRRYQ